MKSAPKLHSFAYIGNHPFVDAGISFVERTIFLTNLCVPT